MTQGSNPFDDDFEEANNRPADRQGVMSNTNNPFDDDDQNHQDAGEQGVTPALNQSNPFDSNYNNNTNNPASTFDNAAGESRDDITNSHAVELSGLHGADASAEASWQYLGDLPYRRVPVYSHVSWGRPTHPDDEDDDDNNNNNNTRSSAPHHHAGGLQHGLAAFPSSVVKHHPDMLDEREVRALLNTTTVTKVAGCPHGGPIAAVTLPIVGQSGAFAHAEVRIMNSAGVPLSTIEFPPPSLSDRRYVPADIMTIGFTDRYVLMIVLRDSLCLTYNLSGDVVLQPFYILPRGEGKATELMQANTFDGGVAVLSSKKHTAIVELLDDHDPPDYFHGAHIAARRILPDDTVTSDAFGGGPQDVLPPHFAIVTHLPTAAYAR